MLAKRIIPCIDIKNGRVVKGVNFFGLIDAGDPIEIAKRYEKEGADELAYLDITATCEKRDIFFDLIQRTASQVFMPLTVGGGIKTIDDIKSVLRAGADKVSINSSAINNPNLILEGAKKFGKQCIVVAIDAKKNVNTPSWNVFINGGRIDTGLDVIAWAKKATRLGAGELLLTSMDRDGTKNGYDIELTKRVANAVNIPIIASGGAGEKKDFLELFNKTQSDAALAASIFHFQKIKIKDLKMYLKKHNIEVRL
ncbi:MAG: imidazole glycerol phosphate synthase subunit HisF [Elusimicrobiota bacterium]|jgi:cyclase|nr:imidazole glycerol phosphate synthase subunit HisF [Elusimicrobiota bacterium]